MALIGNRGDSIGGVTHACELSWRVVGDGWWVVVVEAALGVGMCVQVWIMVWCNSEVIPSYFPAPISNYRIGGIDITV